MSIEELTTEALRMDAVERAKLAQALISSLDELSEEEIEALWVEEVKRRREMLKNGTARTSPMEEVFARLHARF